MINFNRKLVPEFAKGYKHTKRAIRYAQYVKEGKISASLSVRLACDKFLYELEQEKNNPDFEFYFDKVEAEKVCCFLESLQHVKGKWVAQPLEQRFLKLEPWQEFIAVNIFAWKKCKNGLRRYREAYIEVPRKNGKSFFSAGFGLYMFCIDREPGAEVYCSATSLKQAEKVFIPASMMTKKNKALQKKYGVKIYKRSMELPDGSVFEPIISKPKDGASPHCSIIDEYHEHPDDRLYQSQATGMGGRSQPLMIVITTAGFDIQSPCKIKHDEAFKNQELLYEQQDQTLFTIIYSIDKDDDPFTLEALKKANPNYGVSVDEDFCLSNLKKAINNLSMRADYLTKYLDVWVSASSTYFDILAWQSLADTNLDINDFKDCECFIAVDMAARYDLTVIFLCFIRKEPDSLKHLYVFQETYLPSETLNDTEQLNYKRYQTLRKYPNKNCKSGYIITETDGAEIDSEFIYTEIESLIQKYNNIQEIIFDPWQARPIITKLQKKHPSIPIVEMAMNVKNLSPGMKETTGAIQSKRIHHDGNPMLAWNMQNVTAHVDANDNVFPRKENPNYKIDGAVTLIMCANRTENYDPKPNISAIIMRGGGMRTFNDDV